jgi:hypothetical protein
VLRNIQQKTKIFVQLATLANKFGLDTWCQGGSDPLEVGERAHGLLQVGQLAEGLPALGLNGLGRVDSDEVGQLRKELSSLRSKGRGKERRRESEKEEELQLLHSDRRKTAGYQGPPYYSLLFFFALDTAMAAVFIDVATLNTWCHGGSDSLEITQNRDGAVEVLVLVQFSEGFFGLQHSYSGSVHLN